MDNRALRCNKLLNRIKKGDEKALSNLFIEFGPLFLNIAKKYLFDEKYAEDLLSEVFLDLIKYRAGSFNENKNGLNWLFVIIKKKAFNYNSKYSDRVLDIGDLENSKSLIEFINIENQYDKYLDNIIIVDSLKKLNEYENMILYYKYWENLTIREIAKKLDKPKSTIHNDIKTVLKKIKKDIEK